MDREDLNNIRVLCTHVRKPCMGIFQNPRDADAEPGLEGRAPRPPVPWQASAVEEELGTPPTTAGRAPRERGLHPPGPWNRKVPGPLGAAPSSVPQAPHSPRGLPFLSFSVSPKYLDRDR